MTPRLTARALLLASIGTAALAPALACAETPGGTPAGAPSASTPPAAADAASTDAAGAADVADIVVTARRESERAQDVPIAITAVPAKVLQQTNAYTLADIQNLAPGLVAFQSNARNSSLGIRGIGVSSAADGLDTTVGVYLDGVYLGRPGMALEDLVDVDQVEVLRGPQGTLFGRNAAAGVVNITTKSPSFTPGFDFEGSYGDYDFLQIKGSLTGPILGDQLAGRLTFFTTRRDGVLPNSFNGGADNSIGRDGVRAQLLWTPTAKLRVRVIGSYSDENDSCCVSVVKSVVPASVSKSTASTLGAFADLGYTPVASTASAQINSPQDMRTDQHAVSVQADYDLGWGSLTSISAWRYWHFDPLQDSDGTPLDIIQVNVAITHDNQYTQEFRLASNPGRFSWQAGAFFFGEQLNDHYILNQFGYQAGAFYTAYLHRNAGAPLLPGVSIAPGSQYIGDTAVTESSDAAFAQANYKILPNLTLTGGLRYTYEFKHGTTDTSTVGTPYAATSIPFHDNAAVAENNVSYLASLSYKLTPDVLAYVSYSTGYQSAGLNLNAAPVAGQSIILQPENVTNLEGGVKSTLFDGRVVLNLDAFTERLTGLQANVVPPGSKSFLANVGDIRSQGVESEFDWDVASGLTFTANAAYDDARYTSYHDAPPPVGVAGAAATQDLTGRPVFQAPKWVANAIGRYEWSASSNVSPYAQLQYTYRSGVFGDVQDSPGAWIPGYSLLSARIGARIDRRYDLELWIENALGATYFQTLGGSSIPGAGTWAFTGLLGAPRTFGATVRASF